MEDLLENREIPPDEKASLYSQLLLRQQTYLDKIRNRAATVQIKNTSTPTNSPSVVTPTIPEPSPQPFEQTPPPQTPAQFKSPSSYLDSGIGTRRVPISPADVFQPIRDKIRERREQLKEPTPTRLRESPLISIGDDDETKRRKIRQAQKSEEFDIRKRILENPSSLTKTWITTADEKETKMKKQRMAQRRERKARQPYTPSEYEK